MLKVEEFCASHISFSKWYGETKIIGIVNTVISVNNNARASYFSTDNEELCPITNFSINVLTGNASQVIFDKTNGFWRL